MSGVKLKASLPKDDELNGLGGDAITDAFLADPRKPRVAIVVIQTTDINKSLANGTTQPIARINRIELVEDDEEATSLLRRAQALAEVRTGATPLSTFDAGDAPAGADVLDFSPSSKRGSKGGETA